MTLITWCTARPCAPTTRKVPVGELVPVRISGAMAYDLSGTVDTSQAKVVSLPLELTSH